MRARIHNQIYHFLVLVLAGCAGSGSNNTITPYRFRTTVPDRTARNDGYSSENLDFAADSGEESR